MKWLCASGISLMSLGLVFCGIFALPKLSSGQAPEIPDNSQISSEVIITILGEEHRYQPRPELGYVAKSQENNQAISSVSGDIRLFAEMQIRRIGGRERRGLWIVESSQEADWAIDVMQSLRTRRQIKYVAPLFTSFGQTMAVIPEVVVRVKPQIRAEQLEDVCESLGCMIKKRMEFTTQEYLVDVLGHDAEAVFFALEQLNQITWIEWAAPNTASRARPAGPPMVDVRQFAGAASVPQGVEPYSMFPNDPYFPAQWHLHNTGQFGYTPDADINALEAWEITTGDPNIVVAVIDSGVDVNHPDLINNIVPGYDFYNDDDDPFPELDTDHDAHGTTCAGLVSAEGNNYIGVMGVTWNCKIMPIRIYQGESWITNSDKATAFRWAANHGADILSNSWTGANEIVQSAIVDITKIGGMGRDGKGCVVLAATGNDSAAVNRPARFPEAIAVGATNPYDKQWSYSNYGPELDIVAPSGSEKYPRTRGIMSTDISGDEGRSQTDYLSGCSGTSTATPIVAGGVALMLSVEPDLTSLEIRHFLTCSARDLGQPGRDDYYGWGRVDARAALDMILAKRVDLNDDWKVDDADVTLFTELRLANDPLADIGPAPRPDGIIDEQDLDLLMKYWGTDIPKRLGLEPGLIVHWALDETAGTIAHGSYDVYGDTPYPSEVHGNAVWQPEGGIVGGALQFDGVDDYISTPAILDPSVGDFSVFAWIKGGAPGQVIVSQEGGASWLMANPVDGALRTDLRTPETTGRIVNPPGPPLICSTVVTDGDWHRVGFVRDVSNRILYVDGIEVARDMATNLESANGGLYIGAGSALETSAFFSGLIDDVRIYNVALNIEQIETLGR